MNTGKAYSTDLRKRVMSAVNENILKLKDIAERFKVNVKTIYDWRKQFKKTGNISPKTGYQKGHSHKITDLDAFKKFVEENSDLTSKEMAEKLGNVSPQTVLNRMKDINFTFKKNNSSMKNAMKKKD
jgi:transposase